MSEHRFDLAIDPDRGPCHVGQMLDTLRHASFPPSTLLFMRTDMARYPIGREPLDVADVRTLGALEELLLEENPYDTVSFVENTTGSGWRPLLGSYEVWGARKGLVLVLEEER